MTMSVDSIVLLSLIDLSAFWSDVILPEIGGWLLWSIPGLIYAGIVLRWRRSAMNEIERLSNNLGRCDEPNEPLEQALRNEVRTLRYRINCLEDLASLIIEKYVVHDVTHGLDHALHIRRRDRVVHNRSNPEAIGDHRILSLPAALLLPGLSSTEGCTW